MSTKARQSTIELLRIITICGVVMLHYNGNVAFGLVTEGTAKYYLLQFLEILFICAVNLFVLISGVATIALKVMGLDQWSMAASCALCLLLLLYWISYLVLKRKY